MLSRRLGIARLYARPGSPVTTGLRWKVVRPPVGYATCTATRSMAGQAHLKEKLPSTERSRERFREFSLAGKVFAVTGGARGLGLSMAEALVEAGGRGNGFAIVISYANTDL